MASQTNRTSGTNKSGLLTEIAHNARLVWRLLSDNRIATLTKLTIPGLAAAYLLWPADLLPDVFLGLGQLDDLALLALAVKVFIDLCPADIVRQHRSAIAGVTPPVPPEQKAGKSDTVVDAEYRVID